MMMLIAWLYSLHRFDDGCFLYGVFDGHNGSKAAHFTAQRMPAELLLDQLKGKTMDEEIKEVVRQVRKELW